MNKIVAHILEVGSSGLIGVFLTIGYQHFFTPSQSFTFIYNGEEMIVSESTYTDLIEENNVLKSELIETKQQIESLQSQMAVTESTYTKLVEENNALKNELIDAKQQVENLQSQIDKQNTFDDKNKFNDSEIDNNEITTNNEYADITTLLFDSNNFDNEFKACKDTYGNTFGRALIFSNNGSVIYNLNSKYTSLEFTVANSENMASSKKCIIQIFGDDKLIYTSGLINYNTESKEVMLNVANINKLKIRHYYAYDSWYNASAGDAIIANIKLSNKVVEQYDNINIYQKKYMLEELKLFTGSEAVSNPLISDTYGNQYDCAYSFSNNSSSKFFLNCEYSVFKGKIVPSELMNLEKECQIVIETDTNSQTFDINYYTEPIDFEIDLSNSKFLAINHFYKYDSWYNSTAGDCMLVECYLEK